MTGDAARLQQRLHLAGEPGGDDRATTATRASSRACRTGKAAWAATTSGHDRAAEAAAAGAAVAAVAGDRITGEPALTDEAGAAGQEEE